MQQTTRRAAAFMIAALALSTAGCEAGGAPAAPANISAGGQTSGTFTLAFARCMRAHGVPDFPDPHGESGQLGPGSGIDPNSPSFQAALNGPCRQLAPRGWTGPGKVTRS